MPPKQQAAVKKVKKPFKPVMGKLPVTDKVIIPCKDGKHFLINVKKLIQVTKSEKLKPLSDAEVKLLEQCCGQRKMAQQKRTAAVTKKTAEMEKELLELNTRLEELKKSQQK
uniref:Uncharacterized protein n=1 Tax=Panagrolaimus sp. PS1159 TaxID=55785 RepID=A0AC35GID6_9BILA